LYFPSGAMSSPCDFSGPLRRLLDSLWAPHLVVFFLDLLTWLVSCFFSACPFFSAPVLEHPQDSHSSFTIPFFLFQYFFHSPHHPPFATDSMLVSLSVRHNVVRTCFPHFPFPPGLFYPLLGWFLGVFASSLDYCWPFFSFKDFLSDPQTERLVPPSIFLSYTPCLSFPFCHARIPYYFSLPSVVVFLGPFQN